ncbi:TonB-dependent receptor [Pseudoxanthomonas gei]|nr:TonB-dependent receptor [Pseudoxanthomonas gei]
MKSHKQRNIRPTRKLLSCALASCLMLGVAPAVFAQSTAATIRGQVSADSAPATDAKVTATNVATGLTRSVQSNASGGYSLAGLPPGTYRIEVSAAGQTSSQTVTVAVGQTATLNLGVGGVAETAAGEATDLEAVTVQGTMLTETKTSEIATYVSQKQIDSLPQGTRNFLAFADTVPGMQFQTASDGSTKIKSGAQSANGVNVFIDGVGQKNYVLQGGVSGQDSSRGNPFPQSAIGEYKVITQNYKAEFDQLSSAAIVATTRSGSNNFSGSFFWDYTDTNWRKSTEFEQRSNTKAESKDEQYGISFGGPIIQDQAHFFVAYEAKEYESPRTIIPGRGYTIDELPGDIQAQIGTGFLTAPFKENLYFGKVDWAFGDNHYFELTAKYRDEVEVTNIGGENLPSYGTDKVNDETRVDLRYQFNTGNWLNDAHLIYEDTSWGPRPSTSGRGYILTDVTGWNDVIIRTGAGPDYQNKGQSGYGFQDDLTFTGWEGHTVKMGVKYKRIEVSAQEQSPYNPAYYYNIGGSLTQPIHVRFGLPIAGVGDNSAVSRNNQFGLYIQDDWEVNDKLILNFGVRWDYEESPTYLDYVTPADVASSLRSSTAINNPNSGVNVEDYISDGNNRKSFKGAWAPRLGFSYDLAADQRHVIYGGAGRSYDRNLFDNLQLELTKASFATYDFAFQPSCPVAGVGGCLAWDPSYFDPAVLAGLASATGAGREVFMLKNELKTPYSDQFSLGMRNALGDWMTDVTISHIDSKDGFAFLLGNRRPDGSFFPPGSTWDPKPWGQGFPGFGNLILGTNGIETRSNALYVKVEKPYTPSSGWGATFAYTYTDAEENRQAGEVFSLDKPTLADYGWKKAGGVSPHRFVATGIYDAPWGITVSGKLTLATQAPRYITNCFDAPDFNNCSFDQYEPDGTLGFKQFDLAVMKQWAASSNVKLRVRADVLNVFDWVNYAGYDDWRGGPGDANLNFGTPNSQSLPTRTFKLSFGLDW